VERRGLPAAPIRFRLLVHRLSPHGVAPFKPDPGTRGTEECGMLRPAACCSTSTGSTVGHRTTARPGLRAKPGLAFAGAAERRPAAGAKGRRRLRDNARQVIAFLDRGGRREKPPSTKNCWPCSGRLPAICYRCRQNRLEGLPSLLGRCQDLGDPMALVTSSTSSSGGVEEARPTPGWSCWKPVSTARFPTLASGQARPGRFPV